MAVDLFELNGRVALVTGGNSGIGRTLALALRDAGARVAIGARRAEQNAAVAKMLGEGGAAFELDVTDEASVDRTCARLPTVSVAWTSSSTMRAP